MIFLSSFFTGRTRRRDKKENIKNCRILLLIDWPNFLGNLEIGTSPPRGFSITGGFRKATAWLQQFGEIANVFLFYSTRQQIVEIYGPPLHYEQGFNLVFCPRLLPKERKKQEPSEDPVDKGLIRFARKIIRNEEIKYITHLCLASGDRDYIPVLEEAKNKGLKIIIIAPSRKSLSRKLIEHASPAPQSSKKMIYIFSPSSNESQ